MKLSEKLHELRKQNNMSQEQLAERLGVSRQAVSKWESGSAYPEMDKLLALCKIFNCTLDVLTNDTVVSFSETKKGFSGYVESVLKTIERVFTMLSKMKFTTIIKLLFEMLLLFVVMLTFKEMIIDMLVSLIVRLFDILPEGVANIFDNIIMFVVDFAYIIICLVVIGYIFNKRYLEGYREEINYKKEVVTKESGDDASEIVEEKDNTKYVYVSSNKFSIIDCIVKMIVWFCKFVAFWGLIVNIFVLFILVVLLIVDLWLMSKGIMFWGFLLGIIFSIIIIIVLLVGCANFIFNKKANYKLMLLFFIIGIAGIGAGVAVAGIELSQYRFVDEVPVGFEYESYSEVYEMTEGMFVDYYETVYVVDESMGDEVKVEVLENEMYGMDIMRYQHNEIRIHYNSSVNLRKVVDSLIDSLKSKTIYTYYDPQVKVYATKENIEVLKRNYDANEIREYENECQLRVDEVREELLYYQSINDTYQEQIMRYETEIEQYKQKLSELEELLKN